MKKLLPILFLLFCGTMMAQTGNSGYPVGSIGNVGSNNQVPISNGSILVMGSVPNASLANSVINFTCVAPLNCTAAPALGGTQALSWGTTTAHFFFGNNTGSTTAPAMGLIGTNDIVNVYAAGGGTANAQTVTLSPAATALVSGLEVRWLPTAANTTSTPTLNVNSLGAATIVKGGGAALASNDLTTTAVADAIYDASTTHWELQNPQTSGSSSGTVSNCSTAGALAYYAATGTTISCPGAGLIATSGGLISTYDGITGAGLTFPVTEGVSNATAQTTSQTATNIIASTASAGSYMIRYYIDQNAVCSSPGPGQVLVTFSWTDATHAHSASSIPLPFLSALTTTSGYLQGVMPIYSATTSTISYTTTVTPCTTGTASYDIHASAEQTQ